MSRPLLVAEVKTKSPFGFQSSRGLDELIAIAAQHGDWLSIHMGHEFGGSCALMRMVREMTLKPILAKGVHACDDCVHNALIHGADAVLVVGRIPGSHLVQKCWLEPHNLKQFEHWVTKGKLRPDQKIVWNQRDLSTGLSRDGWDEARVNWDGWLCQASCITSPADVSPHADAILVGSALDTFVAAWEKTTASTLSKDSGDKRSR